MAEPMMVVCPNCGREYNKSKLTQCPGCAASSKIASSAAPEIMAQQAAISSSNSLSEQNRILDRIAAATSATEKSVNKIKWAVYSFWIVFVAVPILFYVISSMSKSRY